MAGIITIRAEDGSFSVRCLECGRVKIYRRGETDCMKCGKDLDLDPLLPTTEEAARSMPDARDAWIAELEAKLDALRQQVASLRERLGDSEDNAANKVRDIQKLRQQTAQQSAGPMALRNGGNDDG